MFRRFCWFLLSAVSACFAGSPDVDRTRLLHIVPPEIDAAARASRQCQSPAVNFTRADFDDDGSFRYVVAAYYEVCENQVTSAVRVFKEVDGRFLLRQMLPGLALRTGATMRPEIIDLENDGTPELLFRVWRGTDTSKQYSLLLFQWKEGVLQSVPVRHVDTRNASFRDLDGDGRLELVGPAHCAAYRNRKTNGRAEPVAPGGVVPGPDSCSNRNIYSYRSGEFGRIKVQRSEVRLSRMAASDQEFSLAEVRGLRDASEERKEFVVQLGWRYDPSTPGSERDLEPETLLLGRALHPLKVITRSGDLDCKTQPEPARHGSPSRRCLKGELVEAHFDRASVARSLPRLQMGKKLEAGDRVSIPLVALMQNGDYASTDIMVSISPAAAAVSSGVALQEESVISGSSEASAQSEGEGNNLEDDGNGAAQPSAAVTAEPQAEAAGTAVTLKKAFVNLPEDQKSIWTSPFRLHLRDSIWVAPMVASAGVLIGSDSHSMERERSNALAIKRSNRLSNGGLAGLTALPAFMYAWGSWQGKPRARETGLLSGEALVNSLAVNEVFKVILARQRPTSTDGQGKFFNDIGNSSFPSTHSMLSWTAASVIAHEYPGTLSQILTYGAAAAVSISRVTGREHFPSDVVVGGAMGWLIGRQMYRSHHDPELESANYGSFTRDDKEFDASKLGSSYVPLESWIYPALERLAALGYIKSQFTGLRPWTRRECLRQVEEAQYFAQDLPPETNVAQTLSILREELGEEPRYQAVSIDSIYSGYTSIAGSPLRDSYHFGQTIWNDFGRHYDQGGNVFTGASLNAVAGPFFMYARGEYQHAPGRGPLTDAQRALIGGLDLNAVLPAAPVSPTDRFYPLDMYAGVQLGEYALTFGKQSLWLGPGESGPLMLSDNADPMYMLRLSRTTPLVLPGILRHLGEIRGEFLFAKLSGHQFPPRPFFNLQKISFRPTKNLEIGFTRASLWAGAGHPFTARSLVRNFTANGDTGPGGIDPGDRKSGFDFAYRLPGLRNWITLYSDFYSDDDPSPLANPRRAAVNPGVYLSHLPGVSKLDLRVEAVSTQSLTATDRGGTFLYFNNNYHDSNTNKGFLFGNQTGRDGRTYQAWSTYHFSAVRSLQVGYRDTKTSSNFLPGGGTQSDASVRLLWQVRPSWSVNAFVQYERWFIPVLRPTAQQTVTGSLQLTFTPHFKSMGLPRI